MRYQGDHWTLDDELGLGLVGDQLARMALEAPPPFTIGLTGKWGSGKTSLLRRSYVTLGGQPLQQQLAFAKPVKEAFETDLAFNNKQREKDLGWKELELTSVAKKSRCIWFSPWQHQNEDNPLIPLLKEIQHQFSSWTKIKNKAGQINRRGGLATMALLERVTDAAASLTYGRKINIATGATQQIRQAWQDAESNVTPLSDGQRFHLLFEDAVNEILSATADSDSEEVDNKSRLIIFIDDLDRCEESVIVRLLEAIKLYLNSRRCIFILGLDDTAVIDALGRYWQRSEDLNREYLEKLFQTRVPVPLPQPSKIREAVITQLEKHQVRDTFRPIIAKDIEQLLEPNPRKVKNFTNSLCAAWNLLGCKGWVTTDEQVRRFVMFHYIQQYHRAVWRLLERQPESLHFLWAVVNHASIGEIANNAPNNLAFKDQRLLMEMFRRAFSHVMATSNVEEDKHSFEDLDKAVENFNQRQDRKRSDEYLCKMLKQLTSAGDRLPDQCLYAKQQTVQEVTND